MKQVSGRQGRTRTNLSGVMSYDSFVPSTLDSVLPLEIDPELAQALAACSRLIGEAEGMSRFLANADMYLTMYVRKEALLSAQIEGTQCTFDDVLAPTAQPTSRDVADIICYVTAINHAISRMGELPLSTRLLREAHARLLASSRGEEKEPGELRHSQNWIGPQGSTIATANFVPPNPDDMAIALSDLDRFINDGARIDPLIKAALVHYQFETIHPFLDGNGRLGRLLITLVLMDECMISRPIIYPSYQLKRRRSEYYDWLTRVRETGDYEGWVRFFCECLLESARDAIISMEELVELHDTSSHLIGDALGRGQINGLKLLDLLEERPIINSSIVIEKLQVSRSTASSLLSSFCELGILRPRDAGRQRYQTYLYEDYLEILRRGGEPLGA